MQKKEIEIKFKISDLELIRKKLNEIGAEDKGRVLEHNEKFDNKIKSMGKGGFLLRLRKDKKIRLTLKAFVAKGRFKEMKEYEIETDNFETTKEILKHLGYQPKWIYEKYRHTFIYKEVEIVIDELPIGENYIEIEGEEDSILEAVKDLGLDISHGSGKSYTQIYKDYCK